MGKKKDSFPLSLIVAIWTLIGIALVAGGVFLWKMLAENGSGGGSGGGSSSGGGGMLSNIFDFVFKGEDDKGLAANVKDWWQGLFNSGS